VSNVHHPTFDFRRIISENSSNRPKNSLSFVFGLLILIE